MKTVTVAETKVVKKPPDKPPGGGGKPKARLFISWVSIAMPQAKPQPPEPPAEGIMAVSWLRVKEATN